VVACGTNPPPAGSNAAVAAPVDAGSTGGNGPQSSGGGASPDAGTPPPERLTTGESAQGISLDDRYVYWAHQENEGGWKHWHYTVRAVPKTGGAVVTLAEGAGNMMTSLVARDGFVYWSMATCPQDCERFDYKTFLYRVPRGGGALQELKAETGLGGIAVDGERIYYRARYGRDADLPGLWSVAVDGTNPRRLTTNGAGERPVLVGDAIYFLDRGENPDSTFWTSLRTLPKTGGTPVELRTETNTMVVPYTMTVHRGIAFANAQVVDANAGLAMQQAAANEAGVWRVPLDGSAWRKILEGPRFVLADANAGRIYWIREGCFGSADLDGSDSHCIDEGNHAYGDVAVDDASVFFVRDGDVFRLARQ
jgi:hypothetical protein